MWYAKARYYDSDLGRFVAEDPLKGNIADIQSQNLYPYVRNNPLKYVDLDGREAVKNNFLDYFGECFNDIKNHDEINDLLQQYIPNFDIRNITGTLVETTGYNI